LAQQIAADRAQFIVSDDGCGFEVESGKWAVESERLAETNAPPAPHFGLKIMRERALELGGDLEIRSSPGEGTQVLITLQIEPADLETAAGQAAQPPTPLRVLLVDDHPLFLEGLANLLKIYGIIITGAAYNGLEAQTMARSTRPDLILMDIEMPVCDGIEATRRITAEFPDQHIIMLTTSASDETLFSALKAGAAGYLLKNMQAEELFMVIAGLDEGVTPIASDLAGKLMSEFKRLTTPPQELNERQWQVLQQIAAGYSYRDTAQRLYLSESTVKREMRQIMTALHLNNRAEAAAYARRQFHGKP